MKLNYLTDIFKSRNLQNKKYFFDNSYGDYVRSHPKRVMLGVAAIFLVVIVSAFYFESVKYFNKEWENQQSVYDVKNEYRTLYLAGGIKSKLLNGEDWSENNFIVKYLNSLSKDAYESAKNKIPATDGEIYMLEYMYRVGHHTPKDEEGLKQEIQFFFDIFGKLSDPNLEIKSKFMREEFRYYVLSNVLTGIIASINKFKIDADYDWKQSLVNRLDAFLNIDQNNEKILYLINNPLPRFSVAPISLNDALYQLLRWKIFSVSNGNITDINGSCKDHINSGDVKRIKSAVKRIVTDILPNYKNSNVGYPEYIIKYVNDLNTQIELFEKKGKTLLEGKCNIKF